MKHIWSLLCEKVIVDSETNNLTLFNTLEQVALTIPAADFKEGVKKGAVAAFPSEVVSLWSRDASDTQSKEEINLLIEVYDPENAKIGEHQRKIDIAEGIKRIRTRTYMGGVKITKNGTYLFKVKQILSDGNVETAAEIPLDIIVNTIT